MTPAILPKTFDELKARLMQCASQVDWVQIDAADGAYVPNKTWPYMNDNAGMFTKIVRQDEALPFWEDLNYEIDLMVSDPVHEADKWIAAGAARVVVHIDSIAPEAFKGLAHGILEKGVELFLGFGIDSSLGKLAGCISEARDSDPDGKGISGIQCMGIKKIGFQGQPFDTKVIQNVAAIRKAYPKMPISVDGGVNLETAPKLVSAGASRLVIGSALFGSSEDGQESSIKPALDEFSEFFS